MVQILRYTTFLGKDVFAEWLESLKDSRAEARIAARLDRLVAGNFGDCKSVGNGVSELRIDFGPGYRIYFAKVGQAVVLLLCGGDKRRQSADIRRAVQFLEDYKTRSTKQ
jgi:putative addiction module killer protein